MTAGRQDAGPSPEQVTDRADTVRSPPPAPAPVTPRPGSAEAVLALQRSAGNRATGRLLQGAGAAGSAGVRMIQRSKLKDFPGVKSEKVECLPYRVERRGCSHYIMIGPGDDWHISIPVRTVPRDLYNHDFGEYHVTDPDGNHYNYTASHVRNGTDGAAANWKAADAVVSKIFGVTPTFVDLPEYNKALLALVMAGKYEERAALASAVSAIKREKRVTDNVAYQMYLTEERAEPSAGKRKREVKSSSPTGESTHGSDEEKEEKVPRTPAPATATAESDEEEEGEEPTKKE